MIKNILTEITNIQTVIELRCACPDKKLEILDALGGEKILKLGINYIALDLEDLHRLKNNQEEELLNYIDISDLTDLLKV